MHPADLIAHLNAKGIHPWVDNGRLKTRSDSAQIDAETTKLIRAHKDALIAFLAEDSGIRAINGPTLRARVDRFAPAPLSYAQQRLWFIDRFDAGASAAYNVPSALRLTGPLNRDALRDALDAIVARHDVLRTRFVEIDREPRQSIAVQAMPLDVDEIDLSALGDAARAQAISEWSVREAAAPFDLAQGPLIRVSLLRLGNNEHVLLVTLHHIVSDGWSSQVLVSEFSELYTARVEGRKATLPPLEIQYADYAQWQREYLEGPRLERQLAFWREQLRGAPALITLPTDRARPARPSHRGDRVPMQVSEEVTAGLRALARNQGATMFVVVLAAWAAVLARLSGQSMVVVGSPVANRGRPEFEPLIGFFANTLALQVDMSSDPSAVALIDQVRERVLAAQMHQDLPFERIVEALQPERSAAWNPLFQVMLTVNKGPRGGAMQLPGLRIEGMENAQRTTQFDLSLTLSESPDGMIGGLIYACDLFEHDSVERMAHALGCVLEAFARDAGIAVSRLPLMSKARRDELLRTLSFARTSYSRSGTIHGRFESQVGVAVDAVAVVCGGESLSYGELNRRANRLAHRLLSLGVKPDTRVALCVDRGLDLVVGVLGILKSGGGYVPLDPVHPAERLSWMVEDSGSTVLVADAVGAQLLLGQVASGLPVLRLDESSLRSEPDTDPEVPGLSDAHLAYVIYTSGSTGTPKGVMVEHGHVLRLFSASERIFGFGSDDVWTLFHSFAFDFSVWEMWGALFHGGRLVVVPTQVARMPSEFWSLLVAERVTVLNQTPTAFRALSAEQGSRTHALRWVISGGEALELHTLLPWLSHNDGDRTQLVNMYGITETTVHVTWRRITAEDAAQSRGSLIGRALDDLSLYVLDGTGEPVPVGVTGELYVGGAGVTRGYLNRAELTAERFVADRHSGEAGARLYRTGDLGRWLSDGTLEYLGRNDFQVKIRGFRIELGEIEARLSGCMGVREAVVMAREDGLGDKRLVAYVVADEGVELSAGALRGQLQRDLSEYMVPSAFVQLDALPLTANGKLDRAALPAPDGAAASSHRYEAPEGETERVIAGIWQSLLGIERVGRDDHFFELGGHSLLAVRMLGELRSHYGFEISIRDVFERTSVRAFAAYVDERQQMSSLRADLTMDLNGKDDQELVEL